jgi:hypothetical protein
MIATLVRIARKVTDETSMLTPEVLAEVAHRAFGRCELCRQPFGPDIASRRVTHHAFFRSAISKRVKHQLWNLVAVHDACHRLAHTSPIAREKLERIALGRLYDDLGPEKVAAIIPLQKGTDARSFVRAYEIYERYEQPTRPVSRLLTEREE